MFLYGCPQSLPTYFLLHCQFHSLCNDLVSIGRPIKSGYSNGKTIFWTLHTKADQLKIKTYVTHLGLSPHSGLPGSGNLYLLSPPVIDSGQRLLSLVVTPTSYTRSVCSREKVMQKPCGRVTQQLHLLSPPNPATPLALDTIINLAKFGTSFATAHPKKHRLFSTKTEYMYS